MDKNFYKVFIASFGMNFGMNMINGVITCYAQVLQANATVIGIVGSAWALGALVLKVIAGPALDSFSRKKVIAIAIGILGISMLGMSVSTDTTALTFFSFLKGCGQAFTATGLLALASDCLDDEHLGSGIGIFSLAVIICQAISPAVALNLALIIGYPLTFAVAGAIEFLSIILILNLKTKQQEMLPFKISLDRIICKEIIICALLMLCLQMGAFTVLSMAAVSGISKGIAQESVGLFFTVYAFILVFTRPIAGKLCDKYGFKKTMLPCLIIYAIGIVLLAFADNVFTLCASAAVYAIGYSCFPLIQVLAFKNTPRERHGAASCTCYFGADIGSFIGPIIGGAVADVCGYTGMWLFMLVPTAICFILSCSVKLDKPTDK